MKHILFFILVIFVSISFYGVDDAVERFSSEKSSSPLIHEVDVEKYDSISEIVYKTYRNSRFGFCAEYPAELLFPEPPPENGDGLKFMSRDRKSYMIASGHYKIDYTLESEYKEALEEIDYDGKKRSISYHRLGEDFFIASGYKEGNIYYKRKYLKGNVFMTLYFEYPPSEKEKFDEIIAHITQSFPDCQD